jgi:hypothetical protein
MCLTVTKGNSKEDKTLEMVSIKRTKEILLTQNIIRRLNCLLCRKLKLQKWAP